MLDKWRSIASQFKPHTIMNRFDDLCINDMASENRQTACSRVRSRLPLDRLPLTELMLIRLFGQRKNVKT